jgi:enoyl-CoA hydratase
LNYENIILKKDGNIGILSINRQSALNALNLELLSEISKAVDELISDEEVYVIIVTGEGRAFVAGADITEMKDLDSASARKFAQAGLDVFRKIEICEKPSIAAINGYALGGGLELAMACDIRIASNKAKFGQPEVGLGITPGFGGTNRLQRLVGIAKAKELIFTTDIIEADEAFRIGLVNKIVNPDELLSEVINMAKKIALKSQPAVRYSKVAINRSAEVDIETGMEIEKNLFGLCFATEDQKEGMKAFVEKRAPQFKGK